MAVTTDNGCAAKVKTFLVIVAFAPDASNRSLICFLIAPVTELTLGRAYLDWFLGDSELLEHLLPGLPLVTDFLTALTKPLVIIKTLKVLGTTHMVAVLALIALNKFVSFCPKIALFADPNC